MTAEDRYPFKQDIKRAAGESRTFYLLFSFKFKEIQPRKYHHIGNYKVRLEWNIYPATYYFLWWKQRRNTDEWHKYVGKVRILSDGRIEESAISGVPSELEKYNIYNIEERYDECLWEND